MADIKTRTVIKGTIKTLDRSVAASNRIKRAHISTKEAAEKSVNPDEHDASEYASNRLSSASKKGSIKAAGYANEKGRQAVKTTAKQAGAITKKGASVKASGHSAGRAVKSSAHSTAKAAKFARRNAARTRKAVIAATKALISALIAGGWVAVALLLIIAIFGGAIAFFGDNGSASYTPVSKEVEQYEPLIRQYAAQYGVSEYSELIKAVMMQESAGKGTDPMQASESGFNKKYAKKPNSITDPEYSISCGVQALAEALKQAKCKTPLDMPHIKLALQGYNYGNGYTPWAIKKDGGYTLENASKFSDMMARKMGWSSYGDKLYVDHVLRYYLYGNYSYDVQYNGSGKLGLPIKDMTKGNITSHFGLRSSPGNIGSTNHQGLDIAFPQGTHILACESGTVVSAGWSGGLGKCIIISHGKGLQTVYGHQSKLNVRAGQKVVRGQYIGEVGSTGNSTGPHLHLGIKVNGSYVNPEKGWLRIP